ncbi:MAG: ATP synthase F0 subunit C [bacterium]
MKFNKIVAISSFALPLLAMAEETAAAAQHGNAGASYAYLAAGFGVAIAAAVVGYAQSRAASAALDGIARNPASASASLVPLILSLAFMEALVLLTFVIAQSLAAK